MPVNINTSHAIGGGNGSGGGNPCVYAHNEYDEINFSPDDPNWRLNDDSLWGGTETGYLSGKNDGIDEWRQYMYGCKSSNYASSFKQSFFINHELYVLNGTASSTSSLANHFGNAYKSCTLYKFNPKTAGALDSTLTKITLLTSSYGGTDHSYFHPSMFFNGKLYTSGYVDSGSWQDSKYSLYAFDGVSWTIVKNLHDVLLKFLKDYYPSVTTMQSYPPVRWNDQIVLFTVPSGTNSTTICGIFLNSVTFEVEDVRTSIPNTIYAFEHTGNRLWDRHTVLIGNERFSMVDSGKTSFMLEKIKLEKANDGTTITATKEYSWSCETSSSLDSLYTHMMNLSVCGTDHYLFNIQLMEKPSNKLDIPMFIHKNSLEVVLDKSTGEVIDTLHPFKNHLTSFGGQLLCKPYILGTYEGTLWGSWDLFFNMDLDVAHNTFRMSKFLPGQISYWERPLFTGYTILSGSSTEFGGKITGWFESGDMVYTDSSIISYTDTEKHTYSGNKLKITNSGIFTIEAQSTKTGEFPVWIVLDRFGSIQKFTIKKDGDTSVICDAISGMRLNELTITESGKSHLFTDPSFEHRIYLDMKGVK